jgi:hypothetical protein
MSDSEVPVPEEDSPELLPLGDDDEARRQEGNPSYPWNDHFFKAMSNAPDTVAGMLAIVLPPKVIASVDLDNLELLMLQLLRPSLARREADVLCDAPLRAPVRLSDGSRIAGRMIFEVEQQTYPVKNMGHRVDGYVTLIHDADLHQKSANAQAQGKTKNKRRAQAEPASHVYPVVIYSPRENRRWVREMALTDELAADPWAPLHRSEYLLADLREVSEEQIRDRTTNPSAQLLVLLLKIVPNNPHVDVDLGPWLGELEAIRRNGPRGEAEIKWILQYIRNRSETPASRVEALLPPLGPQVQEEYMSTLSMVRDEAKAEGEAAGEARGLALALMEVLVGKFGEVAEDVATEVRAASDDQLRAWLRVAGNAGTLDQVFSRPGVSRATPQAAGATPVAGKGRAGFLARWVRRWRRSS